MPTDPLTDYLQKAPLTREQKAAVWDAFNGAADEDALAKALEPLGIPNHVKAGVWDLKADEVSKVPPPDGKPMNRTAMNFATVNGQRVPIEDSPIDLVKGAASTLNPIPAVKAIGKGLIPELVAEAMGAPDAETYGPGDLVSNMLGAQGAVGQKMVESYQQGDYVTAARHAIGWLLPVIGPALDKAADDMQQGRPWRGAGEAIGLALGVAGPNAIANGSIRLPAVAKNPNPVEAAAVEFGRSRGIPVDAGTASGSRFMRGVQAGADNTPLGAAVASSGRQQTGQALARVGGELADDTFGRPMTPELAGRSLVEQMESRIQAQAGFADHAYDTLRQVEAMPVNRRTVTIGNKPVQMALPVDLRQAKAVLKPIYDQLTRQYSVTQAHASAGYKALENIVKGPDYAPLTQVEMDLGAIKSIARGADMPQLRTQSQGLAATGVKQLQAAVDRTAQSAGPAAWRALQNGRASTSAKYGTADVFERIRSEPVQAYRQMTAANDSGIDLLKTVQKETPAAIAPIARAYLEDALAVATAEGGFDRAAKLAADWQRLGAETKRILFPLKGQVQALDNYFLLAKKLAESPNPSGTALTGTSIATGGLIFTNPITGISLTLGAGALSKILRSPKAVEFLTHGLRLSAGPGRVSQAARSTGIASVFNAAREAGIALPAGADGKDKENPSQGPTR